MMRLLLRIGSVCAGLALPLSVAADYGLINGTVNNIGTSLPGLFGGALCGGNATGFIALVVGVVVRFRPLLTIIGGLVMCIFALRMITAQEDDTVTKARTVMTGLFSGLVLAWVVEPFVDAFYGCSGQRFQGDVEGGVTVLNTQIGGIINWALTLAAVLAVLMIIVSGLKAIFGPAKEESIQMIRKTIISACGGLLILVLREFVVLNFLGSTLSPVPLLAGAVRVVGFLLGFLAMAALVVIIYSGMTLVFNMGQDEVWQKTKSHLTRAAIGFVLILLSLALVNFVILPGVS